MRNLFHARLALLPPLLALCFASPPARADDGPGADDAAIRKCLQSWGPDAPFKGKSPRYRTIAGKVKVMGIGGNVRDETVTEKPELVLVKPSVAVMAKTRIELMNPKGWYCLKGRVAVMGKTQVTVHCKAHLASSGDGTAVLGSSEGQGGVAVMGSTTVERVGCGSGSASDGS